MRRPITDLYGLLPEHLRRSDAERGGPLKALLRAAEEQAGVVYRDTYRHWDNYFAETCDDWALSYIADLIALNLIDDDPANNRREVSRTIAYRRRKGTPGQLEAMAADVTGYSCRVVEFFERINWHQNMIHLRPSCRETLVVRDPATVARLGTAFDRSASTADFRPATQRTGLHHTAKVGFFLWRLRAIPLKGVEARSVPGRPGAYHFHTLGIPSPLFQDPDPPERPPAGDWPRADELHVDGPITHRSFLETQADFRLDPTPERFSFARGLPGFGLMVDGIGVAASDVVAADLCAWTEPAKGDVAVDVRLGRAYFGSDIRPAATASVTTDHAFGLGGSIGGGGYDRAPTLSPKAGLDVLSVTVAKGSAVPTLSAALATLAGSVAKSRVVEIADSRIYQEELTLPAVFDELVIQAADRQRPTIVLAEADLAFRAAAGGTKGNRLVLRGLLITGAGRFLEIPSGVAAVVLEDCTIDPGGGLAEDGVAFRPPGVTLRVEAPAVGVSIELRRVIAGPISIPEGADCLTITDSILDPRSFDAAIASGPPVILWRSTVLGDVSCHRLEASEALVTGTMTVDRLQEGCVRFSYFGPGSLVPRRYQCAPTVPVPKFTSTRFGHPAYAQLGLDGPPSINAGGEDGREIGVWASLGGPRRLDHLKLRLSEYLPAGMVPVFVFVT
ncbi:phage tail protein [Tundrisphaera lichenicola]|uniref:phage tail protein n=1 Tax=Tundrisphaera lichenicola TaxID=2029860 RepID=UPI003EBADA3C